MGSVGAGTISIGICPTVHAVAPIWLAALPVLSTLLWPMLLVLLAFLFRDPLRRLIGGVQGVDLQLFGQTVKIGSSQARALFEEVVRELFQGLTGDQSRVLRKVIAANGLTTVQAILGPFTRGDPTHMILRDLRGRRLIVPRGGGRWEADSIPVPLPLLDAVLRAGPDAVPPELRAALAR